MTEQTQPTDAELIDVWAQFVGDPTPKLPLTDADKVAFARAVLAKWGQPAPASQPVAVPAQAGEPWYGHKFKEQHRGIWRCECGTTVKETTADWLDMSADELRNLRTETAALCADYDAARAVLAKWGTPAPVGMEPVAVLKFERGTPGRQNEMPRVVSCNWMPDGEYEVYLAAAPTPPTQAQAGAVPLTDEHIRAMLNKHPPEDVCVWSYRMGIEDAELHHGIKGGQP